MVKKLLLKIAFVILGAFTIFGVVEICANYNQNNPTNIPYDHNVINPESNFFGQKENKELVNLPADVDSLTSSLGYELCATNANLSLYLDRTTLGIAVYDKQSSYLWYSNYPKYKTKNYTGTVKDSILSGVTIEYFDASNLNDAEKYSINKKDCSITYDITNDGFIAHLDFKTLGISFDVLVEIKEGKLVTKALLDTLKEVPYKTAAMKFPKEYKLKSITMFPYFGSENYDINAYAFIPDGSGALIRYTDEIYDTAYIKRLYGDDLGIQLDTTQSHLKNVNNITLPIYGINHGYNQAAFLATVDNGYGSCELHSYPYMYSNIDLNRTFFKYIVRDKFNIKMSSTTSSTVALINSKLYSESYEVSYHFLANENANYSGMAKAYNNNLKIKAKQNKNNIPLKLDILCQDYKKGLFGKRFVEMTSYKDIKDILTDLNKANITNMEVNLIGFNQGGYFDNKLSKPKLDYSLGSKKDYQNILDYASQNGIELYYFTNPIVSSNKTLLKKTVKRTNLELFKYTFKASLEQIGSLIKPSYIDDYFLKYEKAYDKLGMKNFTFDTLGNTSFAYRYQSNDYSRETMIKEVVESIDNIMTKHENYNIALSRPNNYLFNYLSSYYDAPYESSKYAFVTDSIPFISLVLSGNVNLFASNTNYVSDYNLFALRLIEYNIYPSFIITKNPTSDLRYTNFEYLYTTEYDLWKKQISATYETINNSLKYVYNAHMISHSYIETGVAKVSYDNGVNIYINYNDQQVSINGVTIPSLSSYIEGGNNG